MLRPLAPRAIAPWLWLLLALFSFRVVAQFVVQNGGPAWLPNFNTWHSGALPYGVLLASQVIIIAVMARTALAFTRGTVRQRPLLGSVLGVVGFVYLLSMLLRLVLGLTVLPEHPWIGKTLPAVFHVVLASFVVLVSRFHRSRAKPESAS